VRPSSLSLLVPFQKQLRALPVNTPPPPSQYSHCPQVEYIVVVEIKSSTGVSLSVASDFTRVDLTINHRYHVNSTRIKKIP
jgi:hypothetical protein